MFKCHNRKMYKWISPSLLIKKKSLKKNPIEQLTSLLNDDSEIIEFPSFEGFGSHHNLYSDANHIYFNDDINEHTSFQLCRELRNIKKKLTSLNSTYCSKLRIPIYLHLTTNGGCIHSAMIIIDCINNLNYPVYSVIEGIVASAGTLISINCEKRFITNNSYMLIHQLSSGIWGKMAEIVDQYDNLVKLTDHICQIYLDKTKIKRKELEKCLKKDITWNADECIKKGLVDDIYKI